MADIFISYAREDAVRIHDLAHALERHGWSVFWDRRIPTGQSWHSYLGKELNDTKCLIVAWTTNSVASKWVIEEADEGLQKGILIPVLLDDVKPPIGFRSIQAADLATWKPGRSSTNLDQLMVDISTIIGASVPAQNRMTSVPQPVKNATRETFIQRLFHIRKFPYTQTLLIIACCAGIGFGLRYAVSLMNQPEENASALMTQHPEQTELSSSQQLNATPMDKGSSSVSSIWKEQILQVKRSIYRVGLITFGIRPQEFERLKEKIISMGYKQSDINNCLEERTTWLAKTSVVFYYDSRSESAAEQLAQELLQITGTAFSEMLGAGLAVKDAEKSSTMYVHYLLK